MNRLGTYKGGLALLLLPVGCSSEQAKDQLNILFIMTDQQSYYTISALSDDFGNSPYSGNRYFSTPNLDRMVEKGYAFTECYAANPVSGPSRFALLTGQSPKSFGMTGNYSPSGENGRRMLDMVTSQAMGNLFKEAGYETVYAGKVHLPWANGVGGRESIYNPPYAYGFDKFLTFDDRAELADTCASYLSSRDSDLPFLMFVSFMNPHDICMSRLLFGNNIIEDFIHNPRELGARRNQLEFRDLYKSMDPDLFCSDQLATIPDNHGLGEGFPDIEKSKYLRYDEQQLRAHIWFYYRLVEQVDSMIGQVLDALENSPYKDNTVVIFTSDHGEMAGSHGCTGKNLPYEECQRVPFIFMGPGIEADVVDDTPVCNGWDLLPTMLDIADIPIPDNLNGISLFDRMSNGKEIDRDFLYLETVNTYGVLENGRYKYTDLQNSDAGILVDLHNDPGEKRNLINESSFEEKRKALNSELEKQMIKFNTVIE